MVHFLEISGDANRWFLADDVDVEHLSAQLGKGHQPISVPVIAPLVGQLLLAGRGAAHVAVLTIDPPVPDGWVPSYVPLAHPALFLAADRKPSEADPGYFLAEQDTKKVTAEIMHAMRGRTRLRLEVTDPWPNGGCSGAVFLDGETLPMAVVCPITPPPADTVSALASGDDRRAGDSPSG